MNEHTHTRKKTRSKATTKQRTKLSERSFFLSFHFRVVRFVVWFRNEILRKERERERERERETLKWFIFRLEALVKKIFVFKYEN